MICSRGEREPGVFTEGAIDFADKSRRAIRDSSIPKAPSAHLIRSHGEVDFSQPNEFSQLFDACRDVPNGILELHIMPPPRRAHERGFPEPEQHLPYALRSEEVH